MAAYPSQNSMPTRGTAAIISLLGFGYHARAGARATVCLAYRLVRYSTRIMWILPSLDMDLESVYITIYEYDQQDEREFC